jgi:hypothetical protein
LQIARYRIELHNFASSERVFDAISAVFEQILCYLVHVRCHFKLSIAKRALQAAFFFGYKIAEVLRELEARAAVLDRELRTALGTRQYYSRILGFNVLLTNQRQINSKV